MCTSPIHVKKQGMVPCGQCMECRQKKSREWSIRIVHEAMSHTDNSFITLTYDDDNVPISNQGSPTLKKLHLRKFIKDLRNAGYRFRYYGAGEYGMEGERAKLMGSNPHYHILIFGQYFPRDAQGSNALLHKLWNKGHVFCGTVQWESAAYVAKYIQKKLTGSMLQTYEIEGMEPEFSCISSGSNAEKDKGTIWEKGIGYHYYKKNIEPTLEMEDPVIPFHGKLITPPKYYMDKFNKLSPIHEEYAKARNQFNQLAQVEKNNQIVERACKNTKPRYSVIRDANKTKDLNIRRKLKNREQMRA